LKETVAAMAQERKDQPLP